MNIKIILDALAILEEAGRAFNRGVDAHEQMRPSKLCYASEYALKLALEKDCPDVMICRDLNALLAEQAAERVRAAAPDLLSALEALEQAYSNRHSPQHRSACLIEARAVISKARA